MSPALIVVVPTYNEREMLPLFLDEFARTGGECLVVDDSSPDGTGELADELARERPWLHVLHRRTRAVWARRTGPGSPGRSSATTS